jgi:hypothetical protein
LLLKIYLIIFEPKATVVAINFSASPSLQVEETVLCILIFSESLS